MKINLAKLNISLDRDLELHENQITMNTEGNKESIVEALKRLMLSHDGFRQMFNEAAREATKERQKNQN